MRALALLLVVALVGCIHAPGQRTGGELGAAPPDPAKYVSCEATRAKHNTLAALATVVGAMGGLGGVAGDVPTTAEKISIGIGGGVFAATGALLGAFAGFAADDYARANCSAVPAP